jgi:hypothetical protein
MSDLSAEYATYLERFAAEVDPAVDVGGFGKYKGKLIAKLGEPEFAQVYGEYHELAKHYFESLDRGDTINDVVVRTVRELAAKLVLTAPV